MVLAELFQRSGAGASLAPYNLQTASRNSIQSVKAGVAASREVCFACVRVRSRVLYDTDSVVTSVRSPITDQSVFSVTVSVTMSPQNEKAKYKRDVCGKSAERDSPYAQTRDIRTIGTPPRPAPSTRAPAPPADNTITPHTRRRVSGLAPASHLTAPSAPPPDAPPHHSSPHLP